MIKYIIFDCDGVLVDTEIVAAKIMAAKLTEMGNDISLEQYINECSGKTFRQIFQRFMPSSNLQNAAISELIETVERQVAESVTPINGVRKAINQIDLPKAVVSNSNKPQIEHALHVVGITELFQDRVFSASMVEKPKPSPLVYQLAAQTLGITPDECLVIEDSISGVTAATTAGMKTIGFVGASHIQNGHSQKLMTLGAIDTFNSMQNLPGIISRLTS